MQQFYYEVVAKTGEKEEGFLKSYNRDTAIKELKNKGYYIAQIKRRWSLELISFFNNLKRVTYQELALFTSQFSTLVTAGLSLLDVLKILSENTLNQRLALAIKEVKYDIEEGGMLADALAEHRNVFPQLLISMIAIGEEGGILEEVLDQLSDFFIRQADLTKRLRSILIYPIIVMTISIGIMFFLSIFVIPTFAELFADYNVQLPLLTRVMLKLTHLVNNNLWCLLVGLVIFLIGTVGYVKSSQGREKVDRLLFKIPVIKTLILQIETIRFSRTSAALLAGGFSLLEVLDHVSKLITNRVIANKLIRIKREIRNGKNLSLALDEEGGFPKLLIKMVKVGEETGQLDIMLNKVADYYKERLEYSIESLVALLKPALTCLLAIIVGGIVISVMLPMFNMVNII